jgi:hypothetical protein
MSSGVKKYQEGGAEQVCQAAEKAAGREVQPARNRPANEEYHPIKLATRHYQRPLSSRLEMSPCRRSRKA